MELRNLVSSFKYLVSNERQVLLGGIRLGSSATWYSMDYRVYMGSSMTVRPLAHCYCTCALINWSVLRQNGCGKVDITDT